MTSQASEPANETPKFRDAENREWFLRLNIGVARRLRSELDVDLGQVADGKVFIELGSNPEKLAGALWLIVEKQAQTKSVEPEAFAEALDGDTIDSAVEALHEAIVNFSPKHQRPALRKMLAKTLTAQERTAEAAETWIEANAERITTTEIEKAMKSLETSGSSSPS